LADPIRLPMRVHFTASKLLIVVAIVAVLFVLAVRSDDSDVEAAAKKCTVGKKTRGQCLKTCGKKLTKAKGRLSKRCPAHKVCCVKKAKKHPKKPTKKHPKKPTKRPGPKNPSGGSTSGGDQSGVGGNGAPPVYDPNVKGVHDLYPNPPGTPYDATGAPADLDGGVFQDAFNAAMLAEVNNRRATQGVPPLETNVWLAKQAYQQAKAGDFHQACTAWVCGQTICTLSGYAPEVVASTCASWWWAEGEPNFGCPVPYFSDTVTNGHYTQMVWRQTKQIGCAVVNDVIFCNYNPAGNEKNTPAC